LETATLLSAESVGAYLLTRGLVAPDTAVRARSLGGGVSNVVLLAESGKQRLVVKQSLPRLMVADEWLATRERIITEAESLELTLRLTPGAVPAAIDVDAATYAIAIEAAPLGWRTWKDALLAGDADSSVASRLGEILATWQAGTTDDDQVRSRFGDYEAFEQLRVDPYYRTIARRHPALAFEIGRTIEAMLAHRRCLVHADFSPKNVLIGDEGLWVIDHECAHVGDPAFDVAFLLNHLLLKTIHRPADADAYRECARAFLAAYGDVPAGVTAHLGCQLLARVDGKSPAEYLDERGRRVARSAAIALIRHPPADPLDAWELPAGARNVQTAPKGDQ
jgi:5-methylthioribose kinase